MRLSFLSVGLLVLLLFSLSVSAQDVCEKTTKEKYVQREYFKEYPMASVPDSRFEFPNADFTTVYVVLSGFRFEDEYPWGPRLYLQVNYCDEVTHKLVKQFEMYPRSSKDFGMGYPVINYEGPIAMPDNVKCLMTNVKEERFSALNALLFGSVNNNFEKLLFKKVLSRQMRASKAVVSVPVVPRVFAKVGASKPRPLDDPQVDPDATASCYAYVAFMAE